MHDLGHGTYSHLFDQLVMPSILGSTGQTWEHEDASSMMLEHLIDANHLEVEDKCDPKFIHQLIKGERTQGEKGWMFDIVANKRNSIDVDKFDYLHRDAYNIGLKNIHFDYERLIKSSKVIGNEVCFNQKNDYELYGLF
jgi:deoxynucleoside triphosphate triphosphohydrolase SAMHD1